MELFIRVLLVLVVIAATVIGYYYVRQRSMLYFPDSTGPSADLLPAGGHPLELQTRDGLSLPAWFLPSTSAPIPTSTARSAVVIFNGNAGDRSYRLPLANALAERGYGVLLFDYRGFAGNSGSPSEEGLRADALAAVEALAAQPEVDPHRIAYFGESLGAAVAGGLATERPPAALILRSPLPSVAEVGQHHYPWLPVIDPLLLDKYRLREQVQQLHVPILVLVAQHDEVIPVEMSRRVFDAANEPKRYVVLDAIDHNDPALLDGEQLLQEVQAFLNEWLESAA
jgi:uncharacterized protein